MSFALEVAPRALKGLRALPRDVQLRILAKLDEARRDPARSFRRLTGSKVHRLRVGDYRVLAELDAPGRRICVLHVAHRRDAYD